LGVIQVWLPMDCAEGTVAGLGICVDLAQ